MKHLVWKMILPISIILMTIITKWWYVLVIDGPDELFYGFPFSFVCSGWHTSMSLQIFIAELVADFLTYFFTVYLLIYLVNRFMIRIIIPKFISTLLLTISSIIIVIFGIFCFNPENSFFFKKDFEMKTMDSGLKFIWQNIDVPDFNNYQSKLRDDELRPKSILRSNWIIKTDSIDRETLIDHGEFLTDKKRVYSKFDFSDGTMILELNEADRTSFNTFGRSIYARDAYHIYVSRHGIFKNADLETFHVVELEIDHHIRQFGRDKFNYYFWDEVIPDTSGFSLKTKKTISVSN